MFLGGGINVWVMPHSQVVLPHLSPAAVHGSSFILPLYWYNCSFCIHGLLDVYCFSFLHIMTSDIYNVWFFFWSFVLGSPGYFRVFQGIPFILNHFLCHFFELEFFTFSLLIFLMYEMLLLAHTSCTCHLATSGGVRSQPHFSESSTFRLSVILQCFRPCVYGCPLHVDSFFLLDLTICFVLSLSTTCSRVLWTWVLGRGEWVSRLSLRS